MRDQIGELARANNRSVNAEVVVCLEKLVKRGNGVAVDPPAEDLNSAMSKMQEQMIKLSDQMTNLMDFIEASISPTPHKRLKELRAPRETAR